MFSSTHDPLVLPKDKSRLIGSFAYIKSIHLVFDNQDAYTRHPSSGRIFWANTAYKSSVRKWLSNRFLFVDIMVMLSMIACHPAKTGNFVGKTGKREIHKGTNSLEFLETGIPVFKP